MARLDRAIHAFPLRHCEAQRAVAIQNLAALDCFAPLAMTNFN
jgi:hypothetical protein